MTSYTLSLSLESSPGPLALWLSQRRSHSMWVRSVMRTGAKYLHLCCAEGSATPFAASPRPWRSGQGALNFPGRKMPLAADTAPVWALSFVVPLGGCFVVECLLVSADTFSLFAAFLLCFLLVFVGHSLG